MDIPNVESMILAVAGYAFHLLKLWHEATKRNEEFVNRAFFISVPMNLLSIGILVYIGDKLPEDLIVMSPLTAVIIGFFSSSLLAGFINVKKPKIEEQD